MGAKDRVIGYRVLLLGPVQPVFPLGVRLGAIPAFFDGKLWKLKQKCGQLRRRPEQNRCLGFTLLLKHNWP